MDDLVARGREVLAHVVGANRELAMAAVDEDCQPDRHRPPLVGDRVERGAHGAAGVEHVVDEHDGVAAHLRQRVAALHDRGMRDPRQVVAIEGDVERPDRDRCTLVLLDERRQPSCERDAAAADADEDERVGAAVALDDLVRDARQRAADLIGVEDGALGHGCSLAASPDRVKGGASEYTDALAPPRLSRGPARSTRRRCSATCRPRPPARRCCGRRSRGRRTSRTCRPPRRASGTP